MPAAVRWMLGCWPTRVCGVWGWCYACRERGKPRAAVQLLCTLGMYEDAVGAALAIDLALAKAVANRPPEEEEGLRRKLWLLLAQAVVQRQVAAAPADGSGAAAASAIRQAVEFIKEANGLLQIEDILPCFPDCATIDNFRCALVWGRGEGCPSAPWANARRGSRPRSLRTC